MKIITILAIEGCLSSSIANLVDSFGIANLWYRQLSNKDEDLFRTQVTGISNKKIVCRDCIAVHPHLSIDKTSEFDYLILPALLPVPDSNTLRVPKLLDYIQCQYAKGTTIASVCTGAFLLAETGLLDGKIATTHWQFERKFRFRHPQVKLKIGEMITESDNLICTGAVTSIMHLVLNIIKKEGSVRLASACAKAMLIDPNCESQAPYAMYPLPRKHKDSAILQAEKYMRENLSENLSIDRLAEIVSISSRHFTRRFKLATGETPLSYLQQLRIEKAKFQLENTAMNIDEITNLVGYEDSSTFRRLFRKYTRLSPREYRDRFLLNS